ncbi:MAG: hypothetical protein GKR89_11215 [Candidatus Latescibacteria bacterium]|nr:hypothetical protein [Candidatus Latescibacterota bacterium]
MVYELRIYRLHPGTKPAFLEGFKKARRFMKKYGMTFVAAWENPDREDEFIWIRSFANLKARDKSTEAFYGSPEWAKIVDDLRPCIRRREVRVMKSLPYSTLK